jgi:hypothetical protein
MRDRMFVSHNVLTLEGNFSDQSCFSDEGSNAASSPDSIPKNFSKRSI